MQFVSDVSNQCHETIRFTVEIIVLTLNNYVRKKV